MTGGIPLAEPGHPVAFRAVRHSAFGGEAQDKEQAGHVSRRVLQAAVPPAAAVFDFAPDVLAAKC